MARASLAVMTGMDSTGQWHLLWYYDITRLMEAPIRFLDQTTISTGLTSTILQGKSSLLAIPGKDKAVMG